MSAMAAAATKQTAFQERMAGIETLVQQLQSSGNSQLRAAALELSQSLMELHGAALTRMMEIVGNAGETGERIVENFTADELIASLLLLYGLHPVDLETRVKQALEKVRPYLRSHGGDVELNRVDGDIVRLRLQGNCKDCPSSALTLRLAVENAIYEAAPETGQILSDDMETLSASKPTP